MAITNLPARYTPLGSPASGGFSHVFKCKDNHLGRDVAIKFIQDEGEKHRLLDELRALLKMRSKHVVQVYDLVPGENDSIGIVEEFVAGEDLWDSDYPRQSPETYLKTLWQISAGIADIHACGVIHRDIKPNNMKLDDEGIVKIFDFGLAKGAGGDAKTMGFKGTPSFAAPELFGHATVAFTPAIDTYAFGATAFFLACQDLPPELQGVPPQPIANPVFSKLPISIPTEVSALLDKCLSLSPSDRPAMERVRDELSRYLLRDRHQALAVHRKAPYVINVGKRSVGFDYPNIGKIEIGYDGLKFVVKVALGDVFINNSPARQGAELPGSCVVALGGAYMGNKREYITFDVSNPEVVL